MKKAPPTIYPSTHAISIPASVPAPLPVSTIISPTDETFWVTNVTNRNVSLLDLNMTVRAFMTINLLDKRHYNFTSEQVMNSVQNGSIYRKRNMIKVRAVPPQNNRIQSILTQETSVPSRARSAIPTIQPNYEELNLSDDKFAEEASEFVEKDKKPIIQR